MRFDDAIESSYDYVAPYVKDGAKYASLNEGAWMISFLLLNDEYSPKPYSSMVFLDGILKCIEKTKDEIDLSAAWLAFATLQFCDDLKRGKVEMDERAQEIDLRPLRRICHRILGWKAWDDVLQKEHAGDNENRRICVERIDEYLASKKTGSNDAYLNPKYWHKMLANDKAAEKSRLLFELKSTLLNDGITFTPTQARHRDACLATILTTLSGFKKSHAAIIEAGLTAKNSCARSAAIYNLMNWPKKEVRRDLVLRVEEMLEQETDCDTLAIMQDFVYQMHQPGNSDKSINDVLSSTRIRH